MAKRGTTTKTGQRFITRSRTVSPSTKTPKPARPGVFGTSSQFKGVGRGVKGDPRK